MSTNVLQRFRDGLASGRFTMTQVSKATGIPLTTLSYIRGSDWGDGVLDKIAKLEAALDEIEADAAARRRSSNTRKRRGERATA